MKNSSLHYTKKHPKALVRFDWCTFLFLILHKKRFVSHGYEHAGIRQCVLCMSIPLRVRPAKAPMRCKLFYAKYQKRKITNKNLLQTIPHIPNGMYPFSRLSQFLTQCFDMHIQCAGFPLKGCSPHTIHQKISWHNISGVI